MGFGFTLICGLVLWSGSTLGQSAGASDDKPGANAPKSPTRKLSELREDQVDAPASPVRDLAKEEAAKKAAEEEANATGFFGDPKKFTRLGGWGSFGNAMGQFGFSKMTLIMMPPIQEELKLTDDQKKKLREWQESLRKKGEEMGRTMREKQGDDPFKASENLPIAVRVVQFTSMLNQISSFVQQNEEGLNKILNPAQRKRLYQISLQMEGISALSRPEVIDALGIDEEQHQEIQQILNQSRALQMSTWIGSMMKMRDQEKNPKAVEAESRPEPKAQKTKNAKPIEKPKPATEPQTPVDREKMMKQRFESMRDRTDQIQSQTVKQITQVLSNGQRRTFEILLGPPFDPRKINNLGRPPQRREPGTTADPKPSTDKKTP
jgi:hypothetical protein